MLVAAGAAAGPAALGSDSMGDKSITKVQSRTSPRGDEGQKYLACGVKMAMRLWEDEKPGKKTETERPYETVGYVIGGRAELHLEGQMVLLEPGDSWVVPRGSRHHYRVLEPFTAVEVTCPPAEIHGRDEGRVGVTRRRSRHGAPARDRA